MKKTTMCILVACFVQFSVTASSSKTYDSKTVTFKHERVAPGIWKVSLGKPESFSPVSMNPETPNTSALSNMAPVQSIPDVANTISFKKTKRGCHLILPMTDTEQIYGFGVRLPGFNATGTRMNIVVNDTPEHKDGSGHAPVPFYVSTEGYGVFVDTFRYARFYCGNLVKADTGSRIQRLSNEVADTTDELYKARELSGKTMTVDIPAAEGVDVYVFAGPTIRDAVCRYNLFAGGGVVPPLWGLGIYYRGYGKFNADDVLNLAEHFRTRHIPCSVFGLEPGWHSHAYSCSYVWSDRYPHPDEFLQKIMSMNYQVNLWQQGFVHPTAPFYQEIKPYCGDYEVWGGLVVDFTHPKAQAIFTDYEKKEFVQKGITSFKIDEVDNQPYKPHPWSFPEISMFPSGLDGEQMHSLFGLAFQRTLTSMFREKNIRTWSQVRASHGMASSSPFVLYSDAYDHRSYVRGILNAGFCGLLWQPELRSASSLNDLYRRIQTMICSPQALVNAWFMPHPTWHQINETKNKAGQLMENREDVEQTVRALFNFRMSMIPYLYSAFMEYHSSGIAPFRALVLDYPDDTNVYDLDDEYMMGSSVLVAPIFEDMDNQRKVYLPEGQWYCFWTQTKYAGGDTYEISMPEDQIPLFIKAGSLLPLAEPVEFITDETVFDITVQVYGDLCQPFTLYEDDGVSYDYQKGLQNQLILNWDRKNGGTVEKSGTYKGTRYTINEWNQVK